MSALGKVTAIIGAGNQHRFTAVNNLPISGFKMPAVVLLIPLKVINISLNQGNLVSCNNCRQTRAEVASPVGKSRDRFQLAAGFPKYPVIAVYSGTLQFQGGLQSAG